MQKNVGGTDRIVRLLVGVLLLSVGIAGYAGVVGLAVGPISQAVASVIVALLGAILVVTGATQRCLVNSLIGVDTHRA